MSVAIELQWKTGSGYLTAESVTPTTLRMAFDRLAGQVPKMMRHIGPGLAKAIEAEERRRFAAQGATEGSSAWAELTENYAEWKKQNYPGMPILQLRKKLKPALTNSNSRYAERVYGDDSFIFGTKGVEYASFHQEGTGKMVARPPVDLTTQKFQRAFRSAVQKGFIQALRAAQAEGLAA